VDHETRLGFGGHSHDRNGKGFSILLGALFCGYLAVQTIGGCQGTVDPIVEPETVQQTCELCGTVWNVISLDGRPVPPTIRWCFHDGCLCDQGMDILCETMDDVENPASQTRWLEHCRNCVDCRYASFTPERWDEASAQLSND
jgi:hypothetical protein